MAKVVNIPGGLTGCDGSILSPKFSVTFDKNINVVKDNVAENFSSLGSMSNLVSFHDSIARSFSSYNARGVNSISEFQKRTDGIADAYAQAVARYVVGKLRHEIAVDGPKKIGATGEASRSITASHKSVGVYDIVSDSPYIGAIRFGQKPGNFPDNVDRLTIWVRKKLYRGNKRWRTDSGKFMSAEKVAEKIRFVIYHRGASKNYKERGFGYNGGYDFVSRVMRMPDVTKHIYELRYVTRKTIVSTVASYVQQIVRTTGEKPRMRGFQRKY